MKWRRQWEALFSEKGKPVTQEFLPNVSAIRRFQDRIPLQEPTLLLVFFAVGISPKLGTDYELAPSILIREAPTRPQGGYVPRSDVDDEILARIEFLLGTSEMVAVRWISIEGGDGSGKTRIALEVVRRLASRPIEIKFVTFENLVVPSGQNAGESSLQSFLDILSNVFGADVSDRGRLVGGELIPQGDMLLVLDNLETVICAEVVDFLREVILNHPRLILLTTSQIPTGVAKLNLFDVSQGMDPKDAQKLLRLRMTEFVLADNPSSKLRPEDVEEIVKVCCYIPSAIEDMAALARTPMQPLRVAKELSEIAKGVPDALDITGHFEKVRTSTGLWGYSQINRWAKSNAKDIRRAFRICGVFAGPFSTEDFEAVAGRGHSRWLADLQRAYVIASDPDEGVWTQDPFRRALAWRLLEEVGEAEEIRERFFNHYFGLLLREGPRLGGYDGQWKLLSVSQPNWIRACYLLGDRVIAGDRQAAALFHNARIAIHGTAYYLGWNVLPLLRSVGRAANTLEEWGCEADCARGIGTVLLCQHDSVTAIQWFSSALDLYRKIDHKEGQADALRCLADCYYALDRERAIKLMEEALATVPEEERFQHALILRRLGHEQFKTDRGRKMVHEAREVFLTLGRLNDVASCEDILSSHAAKQGEFETAVSLQRNAIRMARASGDVREQIRMLESWVTWYVEWTDDLRDQFFDRDSVWNDLEDAVTLAHSYGNYGMLSRLYFLKAKFLADGARSERQRKAARDAYAAALTRLDRVGDQYGVSLCRAAIRKLSNIDKAY